MFVFEEFLKSSIDDNLDEKAFVDTSADREKKAQKPTVLLYLTNEVP